MGHFNKALSRWETVNGRQIFTEMRNKAETLGVERNFRGYLVQPYVMSLVAHYSGLTVKTEKFGSFH